MSLLRGFSLNTDEGFKDTLLVLLSNYIVLIYELILDLGCSSDTGSYIEFLVIN